MSGDIYVTDFPKDVKTVAEIPEEFEGPAICGRAEVIARICQILPVDFSDPTWGILEGSGFSIEFNMGSEEMCRSLMLHIRGGGDAVATVARLLQHLGLRAIDCQTSEFFSAAAAGESFIQWQGYRDKVVGKTSEPGSSRSE